MVSAIHVYKTEKGVVVCQDDGWSFIDINWDDLIARQDLFQFLASVALEPDEAAQSAVKHHLLAPIGSQEVWASGVTYYNSRMAREEESESAGGADFYRKVYHAERPELFFKSTASRVAGHGQAVRIRRDSDWNVPEPELTLVISPSGKIVGYTIGNDMSSRSIEAENPLYLPQAKTYQFSAGIGPGILFSAQPLSDQTRVCMNIYRSGQPVFEGATELSAFNRTFEELASWLCREMEFPNGVYLMTGTGIVPGAEFTLQPGDRIEISIDLLGTLVQTVKRL